MDKLPEINIQQAKELLPKRALESNKGTFKKVLTIAGCFNYQGAAYLTAISSLKTGAGLGTLASIESVLNNVSSLTPNLTFLRLESFENICITQSAADELKVVFPDYDVISIGPGLSEHPEALNFIKKTLEYLSAYKKTVVIDADALNAISLLNIEKLPEHSIITPHPKELSRMLNTTVEKIQEDRVSAAKAASEKFNCTTVLKGNGTIICTKDLSCFKNTSGNSALAKAGSGDVLTGIIAGLLSQGLDCEDSAKLGAFIHGLCGEAASKDLTEYCVLAQDIIDYIPCAYKLIQQGIID